MIEKANLKSVKVKDYIQTITNIYNFAKAEDLDALKLRTFAEDLKAKNAVLEEVYVQPSTKTTTKSLEGLDLERDRLITSIIAMVKVYANSPEATQREKAAELLEVIKKYGKSISSLSYKAETTAIRGIVTDIETTPALKATATEFHIQDWLTQLKEKNTEFETLYNSRTKTQSEVEIGKTKVARMETQQSLEKFIKAINAYSFGNEAPYKALADKINTEINRVLTEVKQRTTRENKGEK